MYCLVSRWLPRAFICSLFLSVVVPDCFGLLSKNLNDNVDLYDTLNYDASHIGRSNRVRRSVDHSVNLNFRAFDRQFKLRLQPDTQIFADDFVVASERKPKKQ